MRFLNFSQLCVFLSDKTSGAFCCSLMIQVNERTRHLIYVKASKHWCVIYRYRIFLPPLLSLWCLMSMGLFLLEKVLGGQFKVGHCWVWLFCSINTVMLISRAGKYHGSQGIRVLEHSWDLPCEWVQLQPARPINTFAKLQNMLAEAISPPHCFTALPRLRSNAGIQSVQVFFFFPQNLLFSFLQQNNE